ncbi:MAG TPA: PEP-CTERM sorting domain-containing protein, partial [Albitalea sp.]|nr:PEP-CTERM sorting domain-containing protein [Albitalea sp.]
LPPNNGYGAYARADTFYNGGNAQTAATAYNAAVNDVTAASANLDDGKLHATAWTTEDPTLPGYCTVLTCSWSGSAEAELWDTITLSTKTHQADQVVNWAIAIDGYKYRGKWAWGDGARATAYYYMGTDRRGMSAPHDLALGASNGVTGSFTVPAEGSLVIYYLADLMVSAESGSVADYSNTMAFSWALPDDVQYTSASGRFMAAAVPPPVPEPSSAAMLLAGVGLTGWMFRRRRPGQA